MTILILKSGLMTMKQKKKLFYQLLTAELFNCTLCSFSCGSLCLESQIMELGCFSFLWLKILAKFFQTDVFDRFANTLPKTLHLAKKILGPRRDMFLKHTTCPKCKSLYNTEDCRIVLPDKTVVSKKCSHVEFPLHPQLARRRPCETVLLKTVRTSAGTTFLYPRNLFCYKELTGSLYDFVSRPDFIDQCELWRNRQVAIGVYSDVYDGKVWEEFQVHEGVPFLSVPYNFGLSLNIDWFQPFDHSTYSIGVIYIASVTCQIT